MSTSSSSDLRRQRICRPPTYRTRKQHETLVVSMPNIFVAKMHKELHNRRPVGLLCDIGAPKSVIGRHELNRILTALGVHNRRTRPSGNSFRFADAVYKSLGKISIPLHTPAGIPNIPVEVDIVEADIPALLGLDVLDEESLTPCTVSNRLIKRMPIKRADETIYMDLWYTPMQRSHSKHLYVPLRFPTSSYFTKAQLSKLHRQFFHPSSSKLFNLIKRVSPNDATPETRAILEDLTKRRDPCQRIQHAPHRFRVTIGAENVRFNERIMMDIMYIGNAPILHIVDEATRFSAARFLPKVSSDCIWRVLLECWATIYTGLPNRILTDEGSQFGEKFIHLAKLSNVEVNRTGVEAHSNLGIGERYHEPLRTTFRKIMSADPTRNMHTALACAVKAMNDTLGPEGLVPSALVFGEFPHLAPDYSPRSERSTLQQRSNMAHIARTEMSKIMDRLRLQRALRHAVPAASDHVYEPGDEVLLWKEKVVNNHIGEWIGPFRVETIDRVKKLVYIRRGKSITPYNQTQVKPYLRPVNLPTLSFSMLKRV